jgi:hypothetical protein
MQPVEPHPLGSPGTDPVVLWRASRLREAGFEPPLAEALAHDAAYDLHAVLELVDQGCPPDLAARILAPLDTDARPC